MLKEELLAWPEGKAADSADAGVLEQAQRVPPAVRPDPFAGQLRIILSFDVEPHDGIEAAAHLSIPTALQRYHRARVEVATQWLLDELGARGIHGTFFVVGEVARDTPALVRAIVRDGHELAIHSWDHRRLHQHSPATFRDDVCRTRDLLEQLAGTAVVGYRAPTFSIVRETAWALDVLAELNMVYDSSIYPVWHDRYGVPQAPRGPFRARGLCHSILEVPPATLRLMGVNFPLGGGGSFRLLPLWLMRRTLRQASRCCRPAVAMLYFHPWEFDPEQLRLPLGRLGRLRTYAGTGRSRARLAALLGDYRFSRAIDVARSLEAGCADLPSFSLEG
jgi:polysaccharide deacetylase family protein (PEP-CTERM system associated)